MLYYYILYRRYSIMIEEWKDIKGYEGLYQVSNLGRVKSKTGRIRKTNHR
ncbi:putative DNA-binding protein [Enterococcus phage G01]|nr:putative DNA-binding protein [Enterococcus phage G01]